MKITKKQWWYLAGLVGVSAILSAGFVYLLQRLGAGFAPDANFLVKLLNFLLVWLPVLAFSLVFKKKVWYFAVAFSGMVLWLFANWQKFQAREEWILPEELGYLSQIDMLMGMINGQLVIKLVIGLAILAAAAYFLQKLYDKLMKKYIEEWDPAIDKKWKWVAMAGLMVMVLPLFLGVLNRGAVTANLFELKYVQWNQTDNYKRNGAVVGFLSNVRPRVPEKPEGYSKEAVDEILAKYQSVADERNIELMGLDESDVSVMMVLCESCFDPDVLAGSFAYEGENDLLPSLRRAREEAVYSGQLFSSDYGGGTANMEFESLTGLSNYYYGGTPYTQLISHKDDFINIGGYFMDSGGYGALAMHTAKGEFYKRKKVYETFGFDDFWDWAYFWSLSSSKDMKNTQNGYYADGEIYQQAISVLSDDARMFFSLITMGNHSPYGGYGAPPPKFISLTDSSYTEAQTNWLNLAHEADADMGEFLDELRKLDKKVMVVFYGDHAPGVFGDIMDEAGENIYKTPLFVWQNYESSVEFDFELPEMVSANQLSNIMLNLLGVKKPGLYYLLDELLVQWPVLAQNYQGGVVPELEVLREYSFVNYYYFSGK